MASRARDSLVRGHAALAEICQEALVMESTERGAFLRRGLVVAAFNLLETFVLERIEEFVSYANGGTAHFSNLTDEDQRRILQHTLKVAQRRLQRANHDLSDLIQAAGAVGTSLDRRKVGLELHAYAMQWEGSNMSSEDLKTALRRLHVASPFQEISSIAGVMGFPVTDPFGQTINSKADLEALAELRHRCAHDSSTQVSSLELRSIPGSILRIAASFDVLGSAGACEMRSANARFFADADYVKAASLDARRIEQRQTGYALVKRSGLGAEKVEKSLSDLTSLAIARIKAPGFVVIHNMQREVVEWFPGGIG